MLSCQCRYIFCWDFRFNLDKLTEEEKYDGYYVIVTSEWEKSDEEIIDTYRGLWQIEETFKVTKSDLHTRPVYVSRKDHINSHFLTCFIALVIVRLLQKRLGDKKYSVPKILESLNKASCSPIDDNHYLFDYRDDVIEDVFKYLDIDLRKKILSQKEIRTLIGSTKKMTTESGNE
jgi:transposase